MLTCGDLKVKDKRKPEGYRLQARFVAVVCEFESVKNAVISRLQQREDFKAFDKFFIFKTNDELKNDFFSDWSLISGKSVSFI